LDWQKIYNPVLEKTFFLIFCAISIFFGFFCKKNKKIALLRGETFFLERGHIVYKKREFYVDVKNADLC
jgi:hypothetical protein